MADSLLSNFDQSRFKEVTIKRLEKEDLEVAAQVIRKSFNTVAHELDLTIDNCPTNGAFTQTKHLKNDIDNGKQLFGVYVRESMIGFLGLVYQKNQQVELEKVAIIPSERGNQYGEFILNNVLKMAHNRKMKWINIGIIKENERLKKWYQKNGYKIVGSKKFMHLPFEVLFLRLDVEDEVANE